MNRLVVLIALVLVLAAGCARTQYRTVMVPPRIDLTEHDIIAVVPFESANEGELGPLATRRFTDLARRDQGLVRMINAKAGAVRHDPIAFKEVGNRLGARTIFVGALEVSDVLFSPTLREGYFDATSDGQRFLLIERIDPDVRSITLIQNWAATPNVLSHTAPAQ